MGKIVKCLPPVIVIVAAFFLLQCDLRGDTQFLSESKLLTEESAIQDGDDTEEQPTPGTPSPGNPAPDPEPPLSENTAPGEMRAVIANPGRGWYGVWEIENGSPNLSAYRSNGITVIMVETDLGNYASRDLDTQKLNQIRSALAAVRNADLSAIFRAAYSYSESDYQNAIYREPETMDIILKHIGQLKAIFSDYEDILLSVQAGFLGIWGEWHTTRYGSGKDAPPYIEHQRAVGNALLDAVPKSVTVSFRRPEYVRNVSGSTQPVTAAEAFGNSKISRSAFHNDALMSDSSDMGTYPERDPQRNTELNWISQHTRYTPMVGETNQVSSFNDTANAILFLDRINMQILNSEYEKAVLRKWEATTHGGMSAYDYIAMMLGYRFVLKTVKISQYAPQSGTMRVELELVNDGFGHLLQEKRFELVLKSGSRTYRAAIAEDARFWDKNRQIKRSYRFRLPSDIPVGNWDVYLGLSSPIASQSGNPAYSVRFSNAGVWDVGSGLNKIGKITLTAGSSGTGGRNFVQISP